VATGGTLCKLESFDVFTEQVAQDGRGVQDPQELSRRHPAPMLPVSRRRDLELRRDRKLGRVSPRASGARSEDPPRAALWDEIPRPL
jgi:hypothetical protein